MKVIRAGRSDAGAKLGIGAVIGSQRLFGRLPKRHERRKREREIRDGGKLLFQTIVESGEGGSVAVPVFGIGELKARTKDVIRLVTQIRTHEVRDAAEHEAAGDQQRRRGGHFQQR